MITTAAVDWTPDHAPLSEKVHTSPVQVPGRFVPVPERVTTLFLNITRKFSHVKDPVERYELCLYWRSVLEQAAAELTAYAGCALAELQDSGLSSRKISALLTDRGCRLSPSGVEQAIARGRSAT